MGKVYIVMKRFGLAFLFMLLLWAFVAAISAVAATPAQAHDSGGWKHKNHYLRTKVIKLHGKEAPGCNLVKRMCKGKKLTGKNVRRYFNTMRAMVMPKPAAQFVYAGKPHNPPAGGRTINAGGTLNSIAQCESGGNPSTNTGNGFYGKYQFTQSTWNSVGGSGNPAAASEAEQDKRAAMLYAREGAAPWPVCGR